MGDYPNVLGANVVWVIIIFAWTFAMMVPFFYVLKVCGLLRISIEEEEVRSAPVYVRMAQRAQACLTLSWGVEVNEIYQYRWRKLECNLFVVLFHLTTKVAHQRRSCTHVREDKLQMLSASVWCCVDGSRHQQAWRQRLSRSCSLAVRLAVYHPCACLHSQELSWCLTG